MNLIFNFLASFYYFWGFLKRRVFIKNIKPTDLVLDIGSGDKPHWRADVVVDKYLKDNQQRCSGPILLDGKRLFVEADVEKLPFKNKVFDFVFCSHLLEHVEHPDKAIEEIVRVGKSGYLEVPLAGFDILKPFPSHLWQCDLEEGRLIFLRREAEESLYLKSLRKFSQRYFHSPLWQYFFAKNLDFIFISFCWKDKIEYRVLTRTKNPYFYSPPEKFSPRPHFTFNFYKIFYWLMTSLFYHRKALDKAQIF